MSSDVFRWRSASLSDPGKARTVNEDAQLQRSSIGLWVVADGMGGHESGDVASGMIVEALGKVVYDEDPRVFLENVEDSLMEVNHRLFLAANSGGEQRTIGSTVVVLMVLDRFCFALWAGDSRIYRLRDGKLQQVTRDHSQVEEMIEHGELLRENAEDHPLANVITRAVGGEQNLYLDITFRELRSGDRYMLCSDGLNKDVSAEEIAALLTENTCERSVPALVDLVLQREALDNVTVTVVDFERRSSLESVA